MKKELSVQLGFWSSVFFSVLGVVYLVTIIFHFATLGFDAPPTQSVQTVGAWVTILSAPALLVIFAVIAFLAPKKKRILGMIGLSFVILFAAMVSINRFVQLTVIRQSSLAEQASDLARFLPYGPGSVMLALEFLGWGVFLSMACLFVAPLFYGSRLNGVIRWLFVLYALFSLIGVVGYATASPLVNASFVAWGPILLTLSVVLSLQFYRGEIPSAEQFRLASKVPQ
jgi:hypothetical protein